MRAFKSHPVLATLATLLLLGLTAGGAYAVVDRIVLSVDNTKSAPEMEQDIKSQLDRANVHNADVHVTKADGVTGISIGSDDQRLGSSLDIQTLGSAGDVRKERTIEADLDPRLIQTMQTALQSPAALKVFHDLITASDADFAVALQQALREGGLANAKVTVDGPTVTISVEAPPSK